MKNVTFDVLELSKYKPGDDVVIVNVWVKNTPRSFYPTLSKNLTKLFAKKGFNAVFIPHYADPPAQNVTMNMHSAKKSSKSRGVVTKKIPSKAAMRKHLKRFLDGDDDTSNKDDAYDRAMKGM